MDGCVDSIRLAMGWWLLAPSDIGINFIILTTFAFVKNEAFLKSRVKQDRGKKKKATVNREGFWTLSPSA